MIVKINCNNINVEVNSVNKVISIKISLEFAGKHDNITKV